MEPISNRPPGTSSIRLLHIKLSFSIYKNTEFFFHRERKSNNLEKEKERWSRLKNEWMSEWVSSQSEGLLFHLALCDHQLLSDSVTSITPTWLSFCPAGRKCEEDEMEAIYPHGSECGEVLKGERGKADGRCKRGEKGCLVSPFTFTSVTIEAAVLNLRGMNKPPLQFFFCNQLVLH